MIVLPTSLLVLVPHARGFSVVGGEKPSAESHTLFQILDAHSDKTHVAVLADVPRNFDSRIVGQIHSFLLDKGEFAAFAEEGLGYELAISHLVGQSVDSDTDLVSAGVTGFILSRKLAERCAFTPQLTQYSAAALFALARELAGKFTVLPAISANPQFNDALADSPTLYDPEWYTTINSAWRHVFATLAAESITPSISTQAAFLYDWQWRFVHASNFSYKQVLTSHEIDQWWSDSALNLAHVDPRTLATPHVWHSQLSPSARLELARIGGHVVIREYDESDVVIRAGASEMVRLSRTEATIELMKSVDGNFVLMGYIEFPLQVNDSVTVTIGKTQIPVTDSGRFSTLEVFGRTFLRNFTFDVRTTISQFDVTDSQLSFSILHSGSASVGLPIRLNFRRPHSKLMNTRVAYWLTDGLFFRFGRKRVTVTRANPIRVAFQEVTVWLAIAYAARGTALSLIGLRIAYGYVQLTRRFRKPVWLFADKMITAGDNGEYLYRYARQQTDGIRKFYVLDAKSPDAKRLTSEGTPFVRFGSFRHKLLYLTADTLFLTHTVSALNNGFPRGVEKFFRGLFNARVVFIQHGLSVQYLPRILNKAFDGIDHYCVASPIERQTLETPDYGYRPTEILDTGLARFDGLVDRSEKIILLSPTWRNYLALPTDTTNATNRHRGSSKNFTSSAFYSIYQSLLTNDALLDKARREGYRIKFLIHPFLSGQFVHFAPFNNDVVEVVSATSNVRYEDLLTEASILVTDYSGIQFDFGYMKKPILYFQPDELPPSYKDAIFRYDRDAFGTLVTDASELPSALGLLMTDNPQMTEPFASRVDSFFYFRDLNNCQRIYHVAREVSVPTVHR